MCVCVCVCKHNKTFSSKGGTSLACVRVYVCVSSPALVSVLQRDERSKSEEEKTCA